MRLTRIAPALLAATLLLGCPADETPSDRTDLVITNGGSVALGKVTVNGVSQGALPPSGVLTLPDIGAGHVVVQAYLDAADPRPCATFSRDAVRGAAIHHSFDCRLP